MRSVSTCFTPNSLTSPSTSTQLPTTGTIAWLMKTLISTRLPMATLFNGSWYLLSFWISLKSLDFITTRLWLLWLICHTSGSTIAQWEACRIRFRSLYFMSLMTKFWMDYLRALTGIELKESGQQELCTSSSTKKQLKTTKSMQEWLTRNLEIKLKQ